MNTRAALIGGAALLLVGLAAGAAWSILPGPAPSDPDGAAPMDDPDLPLPPVPPRVAEGPDYERCLSMLSTDPAAASGFALGWEATGGGDGATHCLALSKIALGHPGDGADMLQTLAARSHAPATARAILYGQATQAWKMQGDLNAAYGSATLALSLSPDDPDLLIDRAVAASDLEHFQDAIDDLTHALAIDPRRGDALTARAVAWRHLNRLDQAQDDVERALTLDPDNPDALLERGIIRQRRDDSAGARTDWERAISLAPDSPTADLAQQNLALLEAGPATR